MKGDMAMLTRHVRRFLLRWQIRDLQGQAESIMHARQAALGRLVEIERECLLKSEALRRSDSARMGARPFA